MRKVRGLVSAGPEGSGEPVGRRACGRLNAADEIVRAPAGTCGVDADLVMEGTAETELYDLKSVR